jgi:hypothetical protein
MRFFKGWSEVRSRCLFPKTDDDDDDDDGNTGAGGGDIFFSLMAFSHKLLTFLISAYIKQ